MDLETSPQECWQIYHQLHSLKKYENEGSFLCENLVVFVSVLPSVMFFSWQKIALAHALASQQFVLSSARGFIVIKKLPKGLGSKRELHFQHL